MPSTARPEPLESSEPSAPQAPPESVGKYYIVGTAVVSAVWLAILLLYFLAARPLFIRMWPDEVGTLLSGWFAPLGAAWLAVAVFLQRDQLRAQWRDLDQNSAALRLQGEELLRSVEQLQIQTKTAREDTERRERERQRQQLDRLLQRVMFGIERFIGVSRDWSLHSSALGKGEIGFGRIFGEPRAYADYARRDELARACDQAARGLESLVKLIKEEWILVVKLDEVRDGCAELNALARLVGDATTTSLDDLRIELATNAPTARELRDFGARIEEAERELQTIVTSHLALES